MISISRNENSRDPGCKLGWRRGVVRLQARKLTEMVKGFSPTMRWGMTQGKVSANQGLCVTPTPKNQGYKMHNKLLLIQSFYQKKKFLGAYTKLLPPNEEEWSPGPWQEQEYPQIMTAWTPEPMSEKLVLTWGLWRPRGSNCKTTRLDGSEHKKDESY